MLKEKFKNNKGSVLVIALFATVIPLTIAILMTSLVFSELKIFRDLGFSNKAFYGAFTGVEHKLYNNDNSNISSRIDSVDYEVRDYEVSESIGNFISTGKFKDVRRAIEVSF
ncbi:hypothetical protein HRbin34_00025 [bacterium HR34]|nr:hypothetical protein HRbin34_00025 [bacterium HR34]